MLYDIPLLCSFKIIEIMGQTKSKSASKSPKSMAKKTPQASPKKK